MRRGTVAHFVAWLALVAVAPTASAASGVIDLSWHTCSPVVPHVENPDPERVLFLVASVLGNDETHDAYQLKFILASPGLTIPDAWRFDAAGCQEPGMLTIHNQSPALLVKACPSFQGPTFSTQVKSYSLVVGEDGSPLMQGVLSSSYPTGRTAVASQRYFLGAFLFDHTFSVPGPTTPGTDCGGFETPMVAELLMGTIDDAWQTSYRRRSDQQHVPFVPGNTRVTVNGSVPAAGPTWGGIKAAYRR